ncbi:hypothetical protein CKAH01_13200 [Colletotrichum kahawae]|uniref:Uncharacterized protein n=1 Tax=Colletotrichum kahawae TaxID=34407 RepID=A0AAD9YNM5_COLKA|nr:hypothetical protein CKAH01_13200 [Colletotrichum kahawae]
MSSYLPGPRSCAYRRRRRLPDAVSAGHVGCPCPPLLFSPAVVASARQLHGRFLVTTNTTITEVHSQHPSLAWTSTTTTTVLAAVVADTHAHHHLLDVFLARMSMETTPSDTSAAVISPPSPVARAHFASSSKQLLDSHLLGPWDLATQASWHRMHPAEYSLRPYPSNFVFCLRLLLGAATPAEGRKSSQGSKTRRQRRHETDKETPASERRARFLAGLAWPN